MLRKLTYAGIALLSLSALAVALEGHFRGSKQGFQSVSDFREWAEAKGLIVWPPHPATAVHVSDDLEIRTKLGSHETAEADTAYKTLVHAATASVVDQLPTKTDHLLWGKVVIYGNPRLLEKLEKLR